MQNLCQTFGIRKPVLVWPGLFYQSVELVGKACEAGALGVLSAGFMNEEEIREAVKGIRKVTSQPFALQIFPPQESVLNERDLQLLNMGLAPLREELGLKNPDIEKIREGINFEKQWKTLLDLKVPVIGLCLGGLREPYMDALKDHGIKTFGVASNLLDAKVLTSSGVDAIVAQSWGTSGLRSFRECPKDESCIDGIVLLQELKRAARIPVIADCSLFTRESVHYALELDISGIVLRDQVMNTKESKLPDVLRESLPYLTDQASMVSELPFGLDRPARVLNTAIFETLHENELPVLEFPFQFLALKDIYQKAFAEGMAELICLEGGQLMYLAEKGTTTSTVQKFSDWMDKSNKALIIVDVQNDFLETGALPVKDGSKVIPAINALIPKFDVIAVTQDWHPAEHISYACNHEGKQPYETTEVSYGTQALWPEHCKAGTKGAELASGLALTGKEHYIKKGTDARFDCYSAVKDAAGNPASDLVDWLKAKDVSEVFVCGLATDFCVCETAVDIAKAGFKTTIVKDACRPVNFNGSLEKAEKRWNKAGVKVTDTNTLLKSTH